MCSMSFPPYIWIIDLVLSTARMHVWYVIGMLLILNESINYNTNQDMHVDY
jgi:hypothetical protein